MKILAISLLLCGTGFAQNLPDAPSAPRPAPFGKPAPGPASSSASLKVSESEALSHVLTRPVQVYPALASVNKIEGDVVIEATIDTQGNVSAAKVISGHSALTGSAAAFVKQWLFRPFYSGETRVPAVTQITVHYSLFTSQAERDLEKHFQETYWPAWKAGEDALAKQDYATAKKQFEIARDEAAKLGQANWQELANALSRLGSVEYRQKNYPAAEPFLLHALQVQQNHREAESPEIADALGNLAQVYMAENDFGKAEPILLKAVEIYDAHLQKPASKTAALGYRRHRVMNLFLLASLNQQMGVGEEAVKYCDLAAGDAPQAMAADEAIIVLRTCETVYRKNSKLSRARQVEDMAQGLEKKTPADAMTTPPQ